jgi:hypothetical protein
LNKTQPTFSSTHLPPPLPQKKHTLNLFYPQSSLFHLQLVARVVVESQVVVDGLFSIGSKFPLWGGKEGERGRKWGRHSVATVF